MKKLLISIMILTAVLSITAVPEISIKVITSEQPQPAAKNTNTDTASEPVSGGTQTKSSQPDINTTIVTNKQGNVIIYNTITIKNNNANNNVNTVKPTPTEKPDYNLSIPKTEISSKELKKAVKREKKRERKALIREYKKIKISSARIAVGEALGIMLPGLGLSHYLTGGIWGGFFTNLLAFTSIGMFVGNYYMLRSDKYSIHTSNSIKLGAFAVYFTAYLFDIIGAPVRAHRYNVKMMKKIGLTMKRINLNINKDSYAMSFNYNF